MEDRFPSPSEACLVKVLLPPERLRPVEGFPLLLSQYKEWMRHTPGGYLSALSAVGKYGKGEASTWDIRRAIRGAEDEQGLPEGSATKWHLLLHLARETEDSRREAGEVLKALKGRGSLLSGVVEEEEQETFLKDLPQFDDGMEIGESFLERVVEAWLALFGGFLEKESLLVTTDPGVMACLSGLWDEFRTPEGAFPCDLRFDWPDLAGLDSNEFLAKRRDLLGKKERETLRDLLDQYRQDPAGVVERLRDELDALGKIDVGNEKGILLTVRHFPASSGPLPGGGKPILNSLSGKTLFLLQGESK